MIYRLVLLFVFTLIVVPFYIDIELVKGVAINFQRAELAIISAMAFLVWSTDSFSRKNLTITLYQARWIVVPMSLYFFCRLIMAVATGNLPSVFFSINDFFSNYLLFLFFLIFICNKQKYRKYYEVMASAFFIIVVFSIFELYTGKNYFAEHFGQGKGGVIEVTELVRNDAYRVKATFEHPLTLGHYTVMIYPVLLLARMRNFSILISMVFLLCVLFLAISSGSRATLVIFVMSLSAMTYFLIRSSGNKLVKKIRLPILLLVAPIFCVIMLSGIDKAEEQSGKYIFESYTRYAQMINGYIAFKNNPIVGYGSGDRRAAQAIYEAQYQGGVPLWDANANTIDNRFVSVLLESGILSFVFFLYFNFYTLYRGYKILSKVNSIYYFESTYLYYAFNGFFWSVFNGLVFMFILSIFTMHPLYYIGLAGLTALIVHHDERMASIHKGVRHV